jgi:hypothetical protein
VDDKLREVFPPVNGRTLLPVSHLLRKHGAALANRVVQWSELPEEEVHVILSKLEDRAEGLDLHFRRAQLAAKLLDLTSLATALAMDFAYTGRLTG